MTTTTCDLCANIGGELIIHMEKFRVVLVDDALYPGFCRVIWQQHIKEMTDLSAADQLLCMQVVFATEQAIRDVMQPEKVNLASFGNMTPHVHWHVIPRYKDDTHFPDSVWAAPKREADTALLSARRAQLSALKKAVYDKVSNIS